MDFLKELFGDKALTFEELKTAVEAVSDKIKVANLKDGGYVDKDKYTAKETELALVKDQIANANKQIEDFKKLDVDGIKAAAEKYKAEYEAAQLKYQADIEKMQFDYAVEKALGEAKAKNIKAVRALLDLGSLKLVGEDLVGLKDQIDKVSAEAPYLFDAESVDPAVQIVKGGGAPSKGVKNPWLKENFNLTEQGKMLKEDPQKARAYMAQAGKQHK